MMFQLENTLNEILSNLNQREKDIILSRFGILNSPKKSLNDLALKYNLSRERVRQIQNKALDKILPLLIKNKTISKTLENVKKPLLPFGIKRETDFFQELNEFFNFTKLEIETLKFFLFFSSEIIFHRKDDIFHSFYAKDKATYEKGKLILNQIYQNFFSKNTLSKEEEIINFIIEKSKKIFKFKPKIEEAFILLKIINRINKSILNLWGPKDHFYISPKCLKHKILHILENEGKPLHFKEITEKLNSSVDIKDDLVNNYWRKKYNFNSVKNELIKHNEFVLVGKGFYALKEWNLTAGTAKEVLLNLLKKNKKILKEKLWQEVSSSKILKRTSFEIYLKKIQNLRQEGEYLIYDG